MKKEIKMLIFHLKKETELFKELKTLINSKKSAVLDNNVKKLDEITRLEDNVLVKIKKEDDAREGITKVIASMIDMESGKVTISEIVKRSPVDLEQALEEERNNLKVLMAQISTENSITGNLLTENLEFIKYELQALTDIKEGALYGSGRRKMKSAILDRMV